MNRRFCIAWRAVLSLAGWLAAPGPAFAASGQTLAEARGHWAYQPIHRPPLPAVRAEERVRTPVDAFLLAALEARGLGYAPAADRRTLLRRVTYGLIGLPPTYGEVEAFERDASPRALERVVDRLLADARYGERWGRHWLDVARYADTKDLVLLYGRDALRPYAYTYRDYVVRAFNEDLPFDQFIQDQIAADQVTPPVPGWRLAALGFLTLGRLFDHNPHDQIDDQIDTVSRGMLGLTVACARCHDHKYDAVSMDDYYGLYGVFASTERPYVLPLIEDPAAVPGGAEFEAQLGRAREELEEHIDVTYAKLTRDLQRRVGDYLVRAATTRPDFSETTQFFLSLTPDDFRPALMLRMRRFLDRRLRSDDRVFGPWAALKELPEDVFARQAGEVLERWASEPLRGGRANRRVLARLSAPALAKPEDVPRRYAELLREILEEQDRLPCAPEACPPGPDDGELLEIVTGRDGPLWFPRRDTPQHMSRPDKDRYGGLVLNLDKIAAHASNAPPARAMVVAELPEPYAPRVFARGSPARPGREVPRSFLRVLGGGEVLEPKETSGRLGLARAIASPTNPLTARVLVNRVWMQHFGEPLVATPADFGARSEPPTHPELLDWLAAEFLESGWRIKHLHRLLVLSAAYQQATADAAAPAAGRTADPDNRLLWQYPRRRLDLEAMRDTLLYVTGRLDPTMGGRPVDVAGDPLNRRRTLYGLVDRQNLPGLFRAFDFAVPDQCVERRPRTSVPQQALFAMNSPFVMGQAQALAELPEVAETPEGERRVDVLYRRVLGRVPTDVERKAVLEFVAGVPRPEPGAASGAGAPTPWAQVAQVLLVSNEAVFLD